jgi:hypothetical protein
MRSPRDRNQVLRGALSPIALAGSAAAVGVRVPCAFDTSSLQLVGNGILVAISCRSSKCCITLHSSRLATACLRQPPRAAELKRQAA